METKNGTEQEVKPDAKPAATEAAPVAPAAPAAEKPKEQTVAEVMAPAAPAEKAEETVPLAALLEVKKDNKELRKALKDLEATVKAGSSNSEIADDIAAIGKKFDVNPEFMAELSGAINARVAAAKAGVEQELGTLKEQKRAEALDKAFRTHFDAAIEQMPDFKDIANPDVIKTLSLDPKNANKTFSQIIEETYGHAIPGKRTIETTTPGGGKEPEAIDYARASKDTAYFSEIMKDPVRKAEYNKNLAKRLRL